MRARARWWCVAWAALLLLLLSTSSSQARVCRSVDVRSHAMFEKLRGCRVVEGFVQVLLITVRERDLPLLRFPELVEVTDYLLVYRARGLPSLATVFPNLAVIRGRALFYNFALVVYENANLVQVGLYSLTTILRGAVIIYKNKNLCYVDTVDWSRLGTRQHSFGNNQNATACAAVQRCGHCADGHCWAEEGVDACQTLPMSGCHAECVGGCSGPGPMHCLACRHLHLDGVCVPACPPDRYEYMGRRCVTAEECRSIPKLDINQETECELEPTKDKPWIPYMGKCSQTCPPDHQQKGDVCLPCRGHCQTICGSGQVVLVTSLACMQSIRHCNYLNGSLIVELRSSDAGLTKELEESLASIEEIDGYLEVAQSTSLVSLRFLRGLRTIHGRQLESDKSALVVRGNPKLERLFPWDQMSKLEILAGRLKIHDNPMLCLSEVRALRKFAGLSDYTTEEVSVESNGNANICKTNHLSTYYSVINSTCVEVSWNNIAQSETLLGYTVHYVEAGDHDVTLDDANDDSCGENGWRVEYVITHNENLETEKIYHMISNMKPYTRYAFFVQTYTIAPEAEKGQSQIFYYRTHPARPSVPRLLTALNSSSFHITLSWEPPLFHNGKLTHYIIIGKLYFDNETSVVHRDFCKFPMDVLTHSAALNTSTSSNNLKTSCCEKKICASDDSFPQLNNIFQRRTTKVDDELCGQPGTLHSVLFSNRLFGEQGGFVSSLELGGLLPNKTIEEYLRSGNFLNSRMSDNTFGVKNGGVHIYFIKKVNASLSSAIIENLSHYGEYSMKIVACREPYINETDDNWFQSRCSPTSVINARTNHLENADDINSTSVHANLTDGKVFLSWDSPPNPNGLIVKYDISYRLVNDEHSPSFICIALSEFIQSGGLIELTNLTPGKYEVSVRATSLAGYGQFTQPIYFRVVSTATHPDMAIIISCIIFAAIIVTLLGVYIWRTIQKERQRQRLLYTIENPEYVSLGAYVEDEWEVARDKVELLKELSHGSFGQVYEGILRPVNVRCAVKTVNDKATVHQKLEFLNEASVMKAFTEAHHVVKLLGVVSKGQPPLVIMELMANGDLKTYLRSAREIVEREPMPRRVVKMAAEIADGMAYLEASKFVHRDLAARNCMVADDLTIKIGDFGMTRDIYETDYYRKESKGLVPVRWMAPESLGDGVFTSKSDVWSYGVVLWEIVTLAEQPYQGMSNEEVLQMVLAGGCLEPPPVCPVRLRHLMTYCWRRSADHRPTFLQVLDFLESLSSSGPSLDDDFRQVSFYHSEAGVQLRSKYDFRAHEEELVHLLGDANSSASSGEYFTP